MIPRDLGEVLVFDIGTTAVKGGVFESSGKVRAIASRPLPAARPLPRTGSRSSSSPSPKARAPAGRGISGDFPLDPLAQEVDARLWTDALSRLCADLDVCGQRPRCVVVSGNGPTLVPIGADGQPLAPAITWMDRRAAEESRIVTAALGYYVDPTFYLPKALWFFRNRRDVYDRTASFLSCPEFVAHFLTGEACAFLPAEGFQRLIWSTDSIRALAMDPEKFPPYVRTARVVGNVTGEAARRTGVPAGTPVVAGGPDFIMSILGTAATRPGRVCDRAGTSEGINLCALQKVQDPRLLDLPHVIEPLWNVSAPISTTGKAVAWFKETMGSGETDYPTFLESVRGAAPGANRLVFLPYLCGERAPIWDSNARGVFLGLALNHGSREMARAVVESTGYAIRDVIEVMESHGSEVTELRATGQPAKSAAWNQIKADITGKPICVPEVEEAELMGDACVGLCALGEFSRLDEAAETLVRLKTTYRPDPTAAGLYRELFSIYRRAYAALKPVFEQLAAHREETRG